jgi:hypothetical protein
MKNLFLATSLLIAMVFIPNQGYSQENSQPELMVVKFHQ